MIKSKGLIDSSIIACIFILLVYHTCTYMQSYYQFSVTVAMFCLIVALFLCRNNWKVRIRSLDGIILIVSVVSILLIGVLFKGQDIQYIIGAYSPYIMWSVICSISDSVFEEKKKKTFLLLYMFIFVVSVTATLSTVVFDHNAARRLAGSATQIERYMYYRRGVGGYGFIYGSTCLLFAIGLWKEKEKRRVIRLFLLATMVLTAIMIVFASYTMALLMMLILFGLMRYARTEQNLAGTITFILSMLAIVLLAEPILHVLHGAADWMGLEYIANRTNQLIQLDLMGGGEQLKRVGLYKTSVNSFLENVWIGGTEIGGHSMLFDNLGNYGIWGGLFCLSYFRRLNTLRKNAPRKEGIVYIAIILLMCVNTSDTIVFLPMVMVMLPMILSVRMGSQ